MIHNRSGPNTSGCSASIRSSSACSASPLSRRPCPHRPGHTPRPGWPGSARRRRAGDGSAGSRSRPARRCRTRPGSPRCRASGSPCRRSPRAAARRPPRPGAGPGHGARPRPRPAAPAAAAAAAPRRSRPARSTAPCPTAPRAPAATAPAVSSPSSVVSTSRESASGINGHQQHRPDGERDAHLPPRHGLDLLPGRADPGGDPLDRPRPAAAVQLLLRGPEPGMITRPALRLGPARPGAAPRARSPPPCTTPPARPS